MAHTPGPWFANLHHAQRMGGRTHGFIMAGDIVPLAAVTLGVEGMSQDEGRANARLIAAAPALLAALKALAALNRTPDEHASPEILAARAALKLVEPTL